MSSAIIDNTLGSLRISKLYHPYAHFINNDFLNIMNGEETIRIAFINNIELENYKIDLVALGLKKEDYKINVERNMVTILCKNEILPVDFKMISNYTGKEYSNCCFSSTFTISNNANEHNVIPKYKDEILNITIHTKPESQKMNYKELKIL